MLVIAGLVGGARGEIAERGRYGVSLGVSGFPAWCAGCSPPVSWIQGIAREDGESLDRRARAWTTANLSNAETASENTAHRHSVTHRRRSTRTSSEAHVVHGQRRSCKRKTASQSWIGQHKQQLRAAPPVKGKSEDGRRAYSASKTDIEIQQRQQLGQENRWWSFSAKYYAGKSHSGSPGSKHAIIFHSILLLHTKTNSDINLLLICGNIPSL